MKHDQQESQQKNEREIDLMYQITYLELNMKTSLFVDHGIQLLGTP